LLINLREKAVGSQIHIPAGQNEAFVAAGQILKAIREQKGMSQEDLAFEAGMDQSTLSKVERVGPQMVSWAKLIAIAEAMGCMIEVNFRSKD
jgi:transcriptional regulator with XRE-family HTH domain